MVNYQEYGFCEAQYEVAFKVYSYFKNAGWTDNAIFGMIGNMTQESSLIPTNWQNGDYGNLKGGLGLVQWTPATKLLDWCSPRGLDWKKVITQCMLIEYELNYGGQYEEKAYDIPFSTYVTMNESPGQMARIFCSNFEMAGDPVTGQRIEYANQWSEILQGITPDSSIGPSGTTSNTTPNSSSNQNGEIIVTVTSGENLTEIAAEYGVKIKQILAWNPSITNENDIYVGEKIIIYTNDTNNTPETSGGSPSISSNPPISTGIDYNSNGGINIGNQPTYNWNARVIASQIDILNLDSTSPGDYYTSAGDHITILDIDGDQQMALIQYPDQSAGIYQQGWISSSYISQDYMDQTFYSLWTNKVENQQIIFHDGTIAETSLTAGVEITFLYTVDYNDTTYACVAYIDDNGNPESGYVPWSSGSLNMIGADIPYYAKYGTEPVELTYLSNAITQASAIDIVDINGISIPNSYTSSGDNILILNVYMEEELVMIEYPDQVKNVHYTGFIPAESLVNGDVSINANTVTWNNSDGSYDMYGISTNDLLYTLPASQTVQFLYRTNDGYACLLFNNNTDNELLESGYTSLSNGSFGFN